VCVNISVNPDGSSPSWESSRRCAAYIYIYVSIFMYVRISICIYVCVCIYVGLRVNPNPGLTLTPNPSRGVRVNPLTGRDADGALPIYACRYMNVCERESVCVCK